MLCDSSPRERGSSPTDCSQGSASKPDTFFIRTKVIRVFPSLPIGLAGYAAQRTATWTADHLECNLILLEGVGNSRVLIVALDTLYPGEVVRSRLETSLAGALRPEEIFVCSSHTHSAPATDESKPGLGEVDQVFLERFTQELSSAAIDLLSEEPEIVRMQMASHKLHHSINRRRWRILRHKGGLRFGPGIGMGPNKAGPTDEEVKLLSFTTSEGTIRALVWNYACHPTSNPYVNAISADFPGAVREDIRIWAGDSDLPVLFLQGFSGNTRPPSIGRAPGLRGRIDEIRFGAHFVPFSPEVYQLWINSLSGGILEACRGLAPSVTSEGTLGRVSGQVGTTRLARNRADFVQHVDTRGRSLNFHGVRLGQTFIVGAPAELVVEYSIALKSRFPTVSIMPVGCIDDTVGYLPTSQQLREGGYEADGFCQAFGVRRVSPRVEAATHDALLSIVTSLS